jgi:hypothetical protein
MILLYKQQNKNLIIYPVKQCFEGRRFMHTGNAFDFSNAYHSYKLLKSAHYMNFQVEEFAMAQKNYVVRCLLNDTMLSVLIEQSKEHLGYSIHPESFHEIINDLLYENIIDVDKLLYIDNIDIFFVNYSNISGLGFSENWESRYYDYIEESLNDSGSNSSSNIPMESATTTSNEASSDSDNKSTTSDSSTNDDEVFGYDFEFLFFVLCAFILIRISAWFFREIPKEAKQITSDIPDITTTLSEVKEETLYEEGLEDIVISNTNTFSSFITPLIILFMPTCLLFIFYYRYYYFNILKNLFNRK